MAFIAAIGIAPLVMPDAIQVIETRKNSTNPQPVALRPRSRAIRAAATIVPMAAIHSRGPFIRALLSSVWLDTNRGGGQAFRVVSPLRRSAFQSDRRSSPRG